MKKFAVSNACNGCGECIVRTPLLVENENGFAVAAEKFYIQAEALEDAEKIVAMCPTKAISIVNVETAADIYMLPEILQKRLSAVKIPDITIDAVQYNAEDYSLNYGYDPNDKHQVFKSKSQAKSAGERSFNDIFWQHRQDYLMDILTQYKSKKIRPFYDFKNREKTFYTKIGKQMEHILSEIYAEAVALTDGKIKLPKNFINFAPEKDPLFQEKAIDKLDKCFDTESFVREFLEQMGKNDHYRKRDYESRIYTGEKIEIIGKDWLGYNKIKTTYCYENVNALGKQLAEDIRFVLHVNKKVTGLRYIDDIAQSDINFILQQYRTLVEIEIQEKVRILKSAVSRL